MSTSAAFAEPGHTPATFNRWDIPVKMGLLIGIASVLLSTISYMFIMPASYVGFLVTTGIITLASIVMYWYTGVRQRKAMGGYITLKEAFTAIFITILISTIITTAWGVVYAKVIDPHLTEKIKESTLAMMESMKAPQARLDQTADDIDKQIGDSTRPAMLLYSYAKSLIIMSIFGFICAAIVRRAPKQEMR